MDWCIITSTSAKIIGANLRQSQRVVVVEVHGAAELIELAATIEARFVHSIH